MIGRLVIREVTVRVILNLGRLMARRVCVYVHMCLVTIARAACPLGVAQEGDIIFGIAHMWARDDSRRRNEMGRQCTNSELTGLTQQRSPEVRAFYTNATSKRGNARTSADQLPRREARDGLIIAVVRHGGPAEERERRRKKTGRPL